MWLWRQLLASTQQQDLTVQTQVTLLFHGASSLSWWWWLQQNGKPSNNIKKKGNFVLSMAKIHQDGWFSVDTEDRSLSSSSSVTHRTENSDTSAVSFTSQSCLNSNSHYFFKISGSLLRRLKKKGVQPALSFNVPLFYSSRCNQHFIK